MPESIIGAMKQGVKCNQYAARDISSSREFRRNTRRTRNVGQIIVFCLITKKNRSLAVIAVIASCEVPKHAASELFVFWKRIASLVAPRSSITTQDLIGVADRR